MSIQVFEGDGEWPPREKPLAKAPRWRIRTNAGVPPETWLFKWAVSQTNLDAEPEHTTDPKEAMIFEDRETADSIEMTLSYHNDRYRSAYVEEVP